MTTEDEVRGSGRAPAPKAPSDRVLTVPNALSMLRLLGVPFFLWLVLTEHDGPAVLVLMVSGVTDWLDGKIARALEPDVAGSARCSTRRPTGSTSSPP